VHPVTDYVNDDTQLKQKHPAWIQLTQDDQQTQCWTAVCQHVQKRSKLWSFKQQLLYNLYRWQKTNICSYKHVPCLSVAYAATKGLSVHRSQSSTVSKQLNLL